MPQEYRLLLSTSLPISDKGNYHAFPDWTDPEKTISDMKELIESGFTFDIENANYWHPIFGPRPNDIEDAKTQALEVIRDWPPLVRIYFNRYMPTAPTEMGNPVVSFRQPSDVVYAGYNFYDYLEKEFRVKLHASRKKNPSDFSPWKEVFFGNNETRV